MKSIHYPVAILSVALAVGMGSSPLSAKTTDGEVSAHAIIAAAPSAATSYNQKHARESISERCWVAHYAATGDQGVGDDHGVATWSCVRPSNGDGAYPDMFVNMVYHRYHAC